MQDYCRVVGVTLQAAQRAACGVPCGPAVALKTQTWLRRMDRHALASTSAAVGRSAPLRETVIAAAAVA